MKKLVNLVALVPIAFLISCTSSPPGRVEEVRNPDGTVSKVLISEEYPYSSFVELYPDAQVKTCAKPLDKGDVQPTVYLAYNGKGKGPSELADWYKGRLEPSGFDVKIEKMGASTMILATKDMDALSITILGNEADGIIQMTAMKRPASGK